MLSDNREANYRSKLNAYLTLVRHSATLLRCKIFDVLNTVNTKHSDFNQIFVNLLSGEPITIDNIKVVCIFHERYFDAVLNICSQADVPN